MLFRSGDYAHVTFTYADTTGSLFSNIIHASATLEEAEKEIAFWFKSDELFDYANCNDRFVRSV